MGFGTVIEYRIRLRGVPVRWTSRTTAGSPQTDSRTPKFAGRTASGCTGIPSIRRRLVPQPPTMLLTGCPGARWSTGCSWRGNCEGLSNTGGPGCWSCLAKDGSSTSPGWFWHQYAVPPPPRLWSLLQRGRGSFVGVTDWGRPDPSGGQKLKGVQGLSGTANMRSARLRAPGVCSSAKPAPCRLVRLIVPR